MRPGQRRGCGERERECARGNGAQEYGGRDRKKTPDAAYGARANRLEMSRTVRLTFDRSEEERWRARRPGACPALGMPLWIVGEEVDDGNARQGRRVRSDTERRGDQNDQRVTPANRAKDTALRIVLRSCAGIPSSRCTPQCSPAKKSAMLAPAPTWAFSAQL